MSTFEFWTLFWSAASAIGTVLAVIVALFKEEIVRIYKRAELLIETADKLQFFEELENTTSVETNRSVPQVASKYALRVPVKNIGKIAARSCEIELEAVEIKENGSPNFVPYKLKESCLLWNDINSNANVTIKSTGTKHFTLFEIVNPASNLQDGDSLSNENNGVKQSINVPPTINIGNIAIIPKSTNSIYLILFCINCENSKCVRLQLEIDLNHKWEPRYTEMEKNIKLSIKKA